MDKLIKEIRLTAQMNQEQFANAHGSVVGKSLGERQNNAQQYGATATV